jgi:hypothetical protein
MTSINSVNELSQKGYKLPKGKLTEIANRFSVSVDYVGKIKNGKRNNIEILKAIVIEAEKYKKTTSSLRDRLNQI